MSAALPRLYIRPFASSFLGHVPQALYESPEVDALLKQRGVEGVRLSYSLHAPHCDPSVETLMSLHVHADTQDVLDKWMPTIKTAIQPLLNNRLLSMW